MPLGLGGHHKDDGEHRGRDNAAMKASTGRGGAGNAVRSPSRGRPGTTAEEEQKAASFHANQEHVRAGRGGAGNVRSPSRDPVHRQQAQEAEKREQKMTADAIRNDQQHGVHSSGRGGMGNMAGHRDESPRGREGGGGGIGGAIRSMSRSRSRDARSSSHARAANPSGEANGDKLSSVDETSTLNGGGSEAGQKSHKSGGLMSKIAHALPGSSHSGS